MGTVRDPNFWKRFSTAVHQDDALKEELAKRPNLTHSYVTTLTLDNRTPSPPLATPNSQTPIMMDPAPLPQSPAPTLARPFPKFSQHPKPQSPMALQPMTAKEQQASTTDSASTSEPSRLKHTYTHSSTQPISPSTPTTPHLPHDPETPSRNTFADKFTRHPNASILTLGFSGRPQSRFKFWTSVTADPSNRNSWLESQQRKRKQRTYICWGFWAGLLLIAAGVVAAILVLKSRGII